MTEERPLDFELWAGRSIRVSWILIWTLVFLAASAVIFSAIPFGQTAPEKPATTAAELQCLRTLVAALETAPEDAGAKLADDPCAPAPSTLGDAAEPIDPNGGERD